MSIAGHDLDVYLQNPGAHREVPNGNGQRYSFLVSRSLNSNISNLRLSTKSERENWSKYCPRFICPVPQNEINLEYSQFNYKKNHLFKIQSQFMILICKIILLNSIYSVTQSLCNSSFGDVVLDSFNMVYGDEGRI